MRMRGGLTYSRFVVFLGMGLMRVRRMSLENVIDAIVDHMLELVLLGYHVVIV